MAATSLSRRGGGLCSLHSVCTVREEIGVAMREGNADDVL